MVNMANFSLKQRIIMMSVGVLIIVSVFIFFYFPHVLESQSIKSMTQRGEDLAQLLSYSVAPGIEFQDKSSVESAVKGITENQNVSFLMVFDNKGESYAEHNPEKFQEVSLPKQVEETNVQIVDDQCITSKPILSGANQLGTLVLGLSLEQVHAFKAKNQRTTLLVSIIVLLLGSAIAYVTSQQMGASISKVVSSLAKQSEHTAAAADEVTVSSQKLADGSSSQASSLEETSSSLEEMAAMTHQNADNARKANELSNEASSYANAGNDAMQRMQKAIEDIKRSSHESSKVIGAIDEIAFQTNLLALNAAVEAARAGEAGQGFAVVADEVRNLAQKAAEAAKTSGEMLEESVNHADRGVGIVSEVAEQLQQITDRTRDVDQLVAEITQATEEQAEGIEQITKAITSVDNITQDNAASSEELASASEQLKRQAAELKDAVRILGGIVRGDDKSQDQYFMEDDEEENSTGFNLDRIKDVTKWDKRPQRDFVASTNGNRNGNGYHHQDEDDFFSSM